MHRFQKVVFGFSKENKHEKVLKIEIHINAIEPPKHRTHTTSPIRNTHLDKLHYWNNSSKPKSQIPKCRNFNSKFMMGPINPTRR